MPSKNLFGFLSFRYVSKKEKYDNMVKYFISLLVLLLSLLVCSLFFWNHSKRAKREISAQKVINPYSDADLKAVIIPSENGTFGYNILVYGSILVHQPSRSGLPGNAGFATEEDAMKVAELVIKKIRNNEMPPTVTIEELRELGVL